jgi:hypothetical protein
MEMNKQNIIMFVVYILLIIIAIGLVFLISHPTNSKEYSFVINGEFMKEVMECDNYWHYENTSFIPCFKGADQRVIFHDNINESLSPQNNCALVEGYNFPGFNVYNDTLAKKMYDDVLPKCWKIKTSDINDDWLKNNADCIHHKQLSVDDCDIWKKGDMLILTNSS